MAERKNEGKLRWSLLPVQAVEEVLKVLEHGAKKYAPNNWRSPNAEGRYFTREQITDSMKRHQAEIDQGYLYDIESGLLHSAHVACNALFQLYYDIMGLFHVVEKPVEEKGVNHLAKVPGFPDEVQLLWFVGKTFELTGWEKFGNDLALRLDGLTYTFTEDPDDGYRSCLDRVKVSEKKITEFGASFIVTCDKPTDLVGDFIRFRCNHADVAVVVGTAYEDDYYPYFVALVQADKKKKKGKI